MKRKLKPKPVEVSIHDLLEPIMPGGRIASALTTASARPYTPISFPKAMDLPSLVRKIVPMEPVELKPPPLPPEMTPYSPPPPNKEERMALALREVGCRSPMIEALTVTPTHPYSPLQAKSGHSQSYLSRDKEKFGIDLT